MASVIGARRSPRSIKNLCNATTIPSLNNEQTATLLSLAQCTGWSADQVANRFAEATGVVLSPEAVWDHHWTWTWGRTEGDEISTAEWDTMQVLMRNIGVELDKPGRPLSGTAKPKTVNFAEQWSVKNAEGRPLFAGFTADCREASKAYLLMQESSNVYGQLTPPEERVLATFGENMLHILKSTLKRWARAMLAKVREDPGLRPIRERDHVDLIMEYLKVFQMSYEERFGKMESGKPSSAFGEIKDNTVFIKCTGYGVKVVLGLLMADRMHVVESKRKLKRETVGFMEVKVEDLEHDSKTCPICQDPMGVTSPEGTKEAPFRMVICCGQVIGGVCLRAWLDDLVYEDVYRDTCPVCRFKFPSTFLQNLFSSEEYAARIGKEIEEDDLVSPSPEPTETVRAQREQDSILQQELGGDGGSSGESGESELMDVGNDIELLRPQPVTGMRRVRRQTALQGFERFAIYQTEPGHLGGDEVMEDDFDLEG